MFIKKDGLDIEIEYGGKDHDNQGFKTTFSIKKEGPKEKEEQIESYSTCLQQKEFGIKQNNLEYFYD